MDKLYAYRDYEIYDQNNNLLGIATSKWILINIETKKIQKLYTELEERYTTENIVAVTYGNDYKTILLNYNNYTVRIVYDEIEYTIPAYEFVIIK
jgi:acyl-ACP thioesterase